MFEKLNKQRKERIKSYKHDKKLKTFAKRFVARIVSIGWGFNFDWLGVPIFQSPIDLQAYQEIIWKVKPDLIIETGIKFGGSIIFSASMLTLLEACGEIEDGKVIGIDVKLPPNHKDSLFNRKLINKVIILKGSSTSKKIIEEVKEIAKDKKRILVLLDSSHKHEHVLGELRAYAPLVTVGSYIITEDTQIENLPSHLTGRLTKGNNPRTAVWEFLKENNDFEIDKDIEAKLVFQLNVDGYLRRVK